MASYVFKRGDNFYYRRRVPEFVADYEPRSVIKISLRTKDKKEAIRKSSIYNDYIEEYWRSLIKSGGKIDAESEYRKAVKLAKAHGFAYKNVTEIAKEPVEEIVNRLKTASQDINQPDVITSVLGGMEVVERSKSPPITAHRPIKCICHYSPLSSKISRI